MRKLKKIISFVLALVLALLCAAPAVAANGYSDTAGHWAEAEIEKCKALSLMQGDGDKFYPNLNITRAELAAVIDRLMGYEATAENTFSDLEEGKWYTESMLRLCDAGVLLGNGLGKMRPQAKVTRQEACTMISRALLMLPRVEIAQYSDFADVADWAKSGVAAMTERGYVNGIDGAFKPNAFLTRAQAAAIFSRIVGDIYTQSAIKTDDVNGTLFVKAEDGIILSNLSIKGDLVLSPLVKGEVLLHNVEIAGNLVVLCDGLNVTVENVDDDPDPTPPTPVDPTPSGNGIKIYLDPGHGFIDPGTVYPQNNPTVLEKDIALNLSLMVYGRLQNMGYDVLLSHSTDNAADYAGKLSNGKLSLPYRYREANNWGADLFLSIHVNSYTNSNTSGMRAYYPNQQTNGSTLSKTVQYAGERLCKLLNSSCIAQVGNCTNSVQSVNYDVLKHTRMLSALFEIGFITNAKDRANMQNEAWLAKMADGIANAIDAFAKQNDLSAYKY